MPLLSLVIITCNAEKQITACIRSAKVIVDEIIVVDSGSTDQTIAYAQAQGAQVFQSAWQGFGHQKRFAVEKAAHDWVLCLDADEQLTHQLQQAIAQTMVAPSFYAYQFARRNQFLGHYLCHGEGYPDMSLRLFNRQYAQWSDDAVHEYVQTTAPIGQLTGDLLHHSVESLSQYLAKQNHYTDLQAQILWVNGEKPSLMSLLFSPVFRFIKFYFLKQGFRDGLAGFIHIMIGCMNSFTKYAKLVERCARDKQK